MAGVRDRFLVLLERSGAAGGKEGDSGELLGRYDTEEEARQALSKFREELKLDDGEAGRLRIVDRSTGQDCLKV